MPRCLKVEKYGLLKCSYIYIHIIMLGLFDSLALKCVNMYVKPYGFSLKVEKYGLLKCSYIYIHIIMLGLFGVKVCEHVCEAIWLQPKS